MSKKIISVSVKKKLVWEDYQELIKDVRNRRDAVLLHGEKPNYLTKEEVTRKYFANTDWKCLSVRIRFDKENSNVYQYVSESLGKRLRITATDSHVIHISEY